MRELMDSDSSTGWAVIVEIFSIDLVVSLEVVHVDEEAGDLNDILQVGAYTAKDVPDILYNGTCLLADIEVCCAHLIHFDAFEAVVRSPRAGARYENEVAGPFYMWEGAPWPGFAFHDPAFLFHGDALVQRYVKSLKLRVARFVTLIS